MYSAELTALNLICTALRYIMYDALSKRLPATIPRTSHNFLYFTVVEHHRLLAGTHCAHPRRDGQAELSPDTRSLTPVLTGPGVEQLR